jgi:acetyl-CoA carboxylase carboxyltransferase component
VAPRALVVERVHVAVGEVVEAGALLATWSGVEGAAPASAVADEAGEGEAPALAEWRRRRALLADEARPAAVARRHAAGLRTARENVADLLDAGRFVEVGGFAIAAQRSRRDEGELQRETPADGLVAGFGTCGAEAADDDAPRVAVLAHDYTVLAGTQGVFNHAKADRVLELAARHALPVVLFAEGGGGRPGDVDATGVTGLDCTTFARFAALSGVVPRIGIAAGRCFAGNAALLGCCDVVIAVEGASLGLGGPAMIEGGGLGRVAPEGVGPLPVLAPAGVTDLVVASEAEGVAAARRLLHHFGRPHVGPVAAPGDPASLRRALPALRQEVYAFEPIARAVFDEGSLLELRREFAPGVCTAVARLEGRAVAVIANRVTHLSGALDAPGCDKLARFLQLADFAGWPIVSFIDTPGFMVGPASEATAMVRKSARVFTAAAALTVPLVAVALRRGYGLGAMAMAGGHFRAPLAIAAWPGAHFGPMGLEGAVRLGFRKELEAAPEAERAALFERLLAASQARGEALNVAAHVEIDDVIDPADTRAWLARALAAAPRARQPRRAIVDAW